MTKLIKKKLEGGDFKMRKILGVFALLSIVILTACGGDDTGTVVCGMEYAGVDTETTIYYEDGYALRSVTEAREFAEGVTEEELDLFRDFMDDGVYVELDGDYIVFTYIVEFEDLGDTPPIEELIEELEFEGFDCD